MVDNRMDTKDVNDYERSYMGYFAGIDLNKLFDTESGWGKKYVFDELTDELISRAEHMMGYPLPESYKELLRFQNGGIIRDELTENNLLTAIYGIATDPKNFNGLEAMFDNWKNEWQYPDIGIPFGETASAGHDMFYLDFRVTDENGEPRVVRVDNEMDNATFKVADNLVEFIRMILSNEPLDEYEIDPGSYADRIVPAADERDNQPPEKKEAKKSFLGKLFGRK